MRTPRIPSMDQIRGEFIEAWAGDFVRGEIAAAQYFDQALNGHNLAIEAAAEQRGAIKALRDAEEVIDAELQDSPAPNYEEDNYDAGRIDGLTFSQEHLRNRADQIEGDDERN